MSEVLVLYANTSQVVLPLYLWILYRIFIFIFYIFWIHFIIYFMLKFYPDMSSNFKMSLTYFYAQASFYLNVTKSNMIS